MHIFQIIKRAILNNYINFKGRTLRKDYIITIIIFDLLASVLIFGTNKFDHSFIKLVLEALVILLLLPCISINIRRLHDINLSGWWYLLAAIIPFGLIIISIALMFYPGTPGPNKYGEPPVD